MCKKDFLRYAELRQAEKKRAEKKAYIQGADEYYPSASVQKSIKKIQYKNARY